MHACPKCHREFSEAGFCPFDGASLAAKLHTLDENGGLTQDHEAAPARRRRSELGDLEADDLPTSDMVKTGTLTGSAVANVLRDVLEYRPKRLIGAELDGRYRIEKQVGEGGMGVVYLARHMVIEKAVAIKVLRAEVAADEAVVKRFVQEARAASRIGHPNIIDVTDFGTTKDGLTYQVMEYLEGQTLNRALKDAGTMDLQRALPIIAQMARALGSAHDKGIVHRDLKPENVFLLDRDRRSDFVKIVDFGIAKVLPTEANPDEQRLTRVGTVFGTPEYMAPEQAAGRTDVDLRADIYALGTILYEMLVGQVPHRGTSTVNTLAMQMLDAPKPMREARPDLNISEDLEAVVMRSLAKKREERFATMAEFLKGLEEVTSKTELDLPLLMRQERLSSELASQDSFDTVPETDLAEAYGQEATSAQELAARAADLDLTPRRRGRSTDPAFLRRSRSTSVQFDPLEPSNSAEMPIASRSKMWLVGLVLLLVAGGVSAFVISRKKQEDTAVAALALDAAPLASIADAGVMPRDASSSDAALAVDGGAEVIASHGESHSLRPVRNPRKQVDAGTRAPLLRGELEVTVVTRPRGAQLFIGNSYAGSDGLNLRRRAGTSIVVGCHMSGFIDGNVKVLFDGKREVYLCRLRETRTKRCVPGVKNPFDDCPD